MSNLIEIEKNDHGVATIYINRPEVRNALNQDVIADLTQAFAVLSTATDVRVIILKGRGDVFCAGADIAWMRAMGSNTYADNITDAKQLALLFDTIFTCPKPTVAVIHGGAYGGGVGLVAACDIVICDLDAGFMLSEVRLGIIPAVISPYLIQAMGARQVQRYTLTAEQFSAEQAQRLGLVHHAVKKEEVEATLQTTLAMILKGSPQAQTAAKKLIAHVRQAEINQSLHDYTATMIAQARTSADGVEGLQAFLSKRQPAWINNNDT